jgi:1-deoxy-D-xylulose-5-phosphate reductoisomerase
LKETSELLSEKKLAIFGSTGSIGTQALDILGHKKGLFDIEILSANNNYEKLARQANHFRPGTLILANENHKKDFRALLNYKPSCIAFGPEALEEAASEAGYDVLLNSLVGFAGFMPTYLALKRNKKVALANKESLVVGGDILTNLPAFKNGKLIPVDSEHSAMLQCIAGENRNDIRKIIITASGGPFRDYTMEQMNSIELEDALNHPNWDMGAKITIDSSTMMNKGLEIIEAKWMFGIPVEKIEPVIHPQSIIHSIVEFVDGSSKAQLGPPDMKVPILYALTYPERTSFPNHTLDYGQPMNLSFYPVDFQKFPCLKLAINAAKKGGSAPAVLNAANEIAVERFLEKEIRYIDIPKIIESSLNRIQIDKELNPSALQSIDKETRNFAYSLLR